MKSTLYIDGGARPTNPGYAGFACVLNDDVMSRYIGIATNNDAEYAGLIVGLKWARSKGIKEIDVYSDSKLVVEQVLNRWRVEKPHLRQYVREARTLLLNFTYWDIMHIPRDDNDVADAYCTKAINWGRNHNLWIPQKIRDKRPGEIHDPFDVSSYFTSPLASPNLRRVLWISKLK